MFPAITKIKDMVFDFRRTLRMPKKERHPSMPFNFRAPRSARDITPSRTSFVMSVKAKRTSRQVARAS